jgi:hypothetical protein
MIANKLEDEITKSKVAKFEEALAALGTQPERD